jgi:amino acid adenylation domain-containing protein
VLAHAAERDPERPAVLTPDGSLTYGELELEAARRASALRELGVRPGDRVAVWAPKSARTVATLYGVMRAGASYVPIDPLSPPARAAAVIDDAGCAALVGDRRRIESAEPAAPVLDIDADLNAIDGLHAPSAAGSDLAYILYTSGSTGRPKGVMLTHRNALAFVEWTVERFGVSAEDRLSSHAPFHFDLSIFDLYGASLAGASLHLLAPGEEGLGASMAAAIARERISVWYSVPSALTLLAGAADPAQLESLRVVLFAGEVFPIKHLRRLRELVPDAALANLYGPTETNVVTYHVADELPDGDEPLPIGRACDHADCFALDDAGRRVEPGGTGELWVRGPTVMQGYWGDPELTAERLHDGAYRTGDLVRVLPEGGFDFVGRRDHQVKIRGYRIELGEIETVLLGHPRVAEVAVVTVPDERLGNRLVAFVAVDGEVGETELRGHCAKALPRYMVPAAIGVEGELPHTSTGKIDRQALATRAAVR